MRQHSITLSLGLIAVSLSSCAQDAPPPTTPGPNPAPQSFNNPVVPSKTGQKVEEKATGNKLPDKPSENKTNITPGLLPPTNPDERVGAKGRKDPFEIIPLKQTDVEIPGGIKITFKSNQFLQSRFSSIRQLPIFPQLPNLNKSQNGLNLPARPIRQLPTFPQLPNLNKSQNGLNRPASPIQQLPIFPPLPNLNPSENTPNDQVRSVPQLPSLSQLPNVKPSMLKKSGILKSDTLKSAGGIKNANNILFVADKPKTSIAKPEQPLVLPPNQEIPVFKPELPTIPEPKIAQGVQVTGVIEIGNVPYAFVKAPDEPSARTVKVGDRLSGGQVLVKRIEVNQKTVVLEQNGIEVNQRLIEGTLKKQV